MKKLEETAPTSASETPEELPKKKKSKISLVPAINEISDILATQKPKATQIIEGDKNHSFGLDELLTAWHSYIEMLKNEKKMNLVSMMTAYAPQLAGTSITLLLDNKTQEQYFNDERISLTNFLRNRLHNFGISLQAEVLKAEQQKTKMYTQQDFYKHLVEINPDLQDFVQKLQLEFDTSKD